MAFDLISMDTLDLLEETESYWIFGFVPTAGDDDDQDAEKFMQKVTGTLKIIRAGNYPEYIRLQNDKPIRPGFGVKIKEFLNIAQARLSTTASLGFIKKNGGVSSGLTPNSISLPPLFSATTVSAS